jgi:uncharacterized membrane-anchored protein
MPAPLRSLPARRLGATKLPEITLAFWVMKICATTLGETAGDLVSMTLHVGYAASSVALLLAFGLLVRTQLRADGFDPWRYWAVILATSTAGTTTSDFMDRTLNLGYARGAAILVLLLLTVLFFWWRTTGSLSVTELRSHRAERFYWAAILCSNTLGTAFGDFLADDSGLGFAGAALVVGGLLVIVVVANAVIRLPAVALFWAAFVLTRPFGATVGDVLTKAPDLGGLGLGTAGASLLLLAPLVLLMRRQQRHAYGAVARPGRARYAITRWND